MLPSDCRNRASVTFATGASMNRNSGIDLMPSKITPIENGPLMVDEPPILKDSDGNTVETKAKAFLCRCGLSKSKPFCDGSHKEAGFSSANDGEPKRNRALTYEAEVEGVAVTVSYTPVICSHAARCVALGEGAFDPNRKPWVEPQQTSLAKLRAVVAACPSGALRLAVGEGPVSHSNPSPEHIQIRTEKNGPYYVENVALTSAFTGAEASTQKYALCRCGLSNLKPFCDGSHRDAGWEDS